MNPTGASPAGKILRCLVALFACVTVLMAFADLAHAADTPAFSVADVSVPEGNTGTSTLSFVVTRTSTGIRSSVTYVVANGSAQAGSDFVAVASATLQFSSSETSKSVAVSITGDSVTEPDETLTITLSKPSGATIADGSATGTIRNDDLPTLSVNNVVVSEGNLGTTALNFVVTRNGSGVTSSVTFATSNGTAVAGTDYVARPATTLNFASADTSKQVTVTVNGDTVSEADETFTLALSSAVNATISDGSGTGTIRNDDQAKLSVDDFSVPEGDSGAIRSLRFTVTRSGDLSGTSSVDYATADDTASAGSDYVAQSSTLNFTPNQTVATVTVTVNCDTVLEPDEKLSLKLSNPSGAVIEKAKGTGTIRNDDTSPITLVDFVDGGPVLEGNTGTKSLTVTVVRRENISGTSSVKYKSIDDTALAGSDYVAVPPTTLTFQENESQKTVTVTVNGDTLFEPNETLKLMLFEPVGTLIAPDGLTVVTIGNDDAALSVSNTAAVEDDTAGNTATMVFTVNRTGNVGIESSVMYATANGSATAGSDYVALPPTTLTFQSGQASKTVSVTLTPDTVDEAEETFSLNLSSPVGATILDGSGVGRILDDDNPPLNATLSVNDVTVAEEAGLAIFTITRSGDLSGNSSVAYVVQTSSVVNGVVTGGTASGVDDFSDRVVPFTTGFGPNESVRTVNVSITPDERPENDETFHLTLSNASGATIADATGRGTIIDNDDFHLSVADVAIIEGNAGATTLTFSVRRLPPFSEGTSTVSYSISAGTATGGTDFEARPSSGTLIWSNTEISKTVDVAIAGDTNGEPDETFNLTLSAPVNALIDDGSAIGTITNDDASLAVSDGSILEGKLGDEATLKFAVTRSGNTAGSSSFKYTTSNGTASAGSDYVASGTTLTFSPGAVHIVISVKILGDNTPEPNETFTVTLSAPEGAGIIDGVGVGTITNDD